MIDAGAPIFVLAPYPRSGTHLLAHLLSAHPSIDRSPVFEDYLGIQASLLTDYAEGLVSRWKKQQIDNAELEWSNYAPDHLLVDFGRSLLTFLGLTKPDRHLLLKSTTTVGLPDLQRLFPTGRMVILLRDPRSIAESWIRTDYGSGASLEDVGYGWANRMRELEGWLDLQKPAVDRARIHFVKFEKLARNPADEYARLLDAMGLPLDPDASATAVNPPVIGSSFGMSLESAAAHDRRPDFTPQPRPEGFDPTLRWADWSPRTHSRFNRTCGTLMSRWGYTPVRTKLTSKTQQRG